MKNNFKLVCFLIISLSYIIFAETTVSNYYYKRVLPGDYIDQYIGCNYERWFNNPIYGESHEKATCIPPNVSSLPNDLNVDIEYEPDQTYYLRGSIVPASSGDNNKIFTYTTTYKSENMLSTNDDTFITTERYQIDDYAGVPQSTQICTLSVLDNWTNDGWSNGYLFAEEIWYNKNIPADIDVFEIVTSGKTELDPGIYCIETEVNNLNASFGVEINLYNTNTFNNDTKMQFMTDTYDYNNRYDDNGNLDNIGQRLYFKNDKKITCYIEVKQRFSIPELPNIEYKIRVFKARPVILVHGINAFPQDATQTDTTFEDMRDYLGYFKEIMPCVCYDFPWDSSQPHNGKGFEYYVGDDPDEEKQLYGFVKDKFKLHDNYKANIILHSMGGFIVRYQLAYQSFADMINQVLFINSPQYGSDLANFIATRPRAAERFNKFPVLFTCQENYIHMSRGGETVWKMHHEKDINIPVSRIAFTVGTSRGYYKMLPIIMFNYDYREGILNDLLEGKKSDFNVNVIKTLFKERYTIGLKRSDGIVPVTSQNLLNLVPDIPKANYYFIEKHHTEAQKLSLNNMNSCRELYDLIKARMNAQ